MQDRPPRLGDIIDDYCPKCRLLLNHDVAALQDDAIAKVTCRTCHDTHDYRHAQLPARRRSKKEQDKKNLMEQVLAGMPPPPPTAPQVPTRKRRDLWAEVERLKKK